MIPFDVLVFVKSFGMGPLHVKDITYNSFKRDCKLSAEQRLYLTRKLFMVVELIKNRVTPDLREFIKEQNLFQSMCKDLCKDLEQHNIEIDMTFLSNRFGLLADRLGFTEDGRYFAIEGAMVDSAILTIHNSIGLKQTAYRKAGSHAEGTAMYNNKSDIDILLLPNVKIVDGNRTFMHLKMTKSSETTGGYTRLQLYHFGKAVNRGNLDEYEDCFCYRLVSLDSNSLLISNQLKYKTEKKHKKFKIMRNGPAMTIPDDVNRDYVDVFICDTLPDEVLPWFTRERKFGWPNKETLELFKHMGCIVVPVGHKKSPTEHLEWRLSFTNQEIHLMHNLNMTQYRCFVILKYIKNEIIKKRYTDSISSYHLKTALFYTIENSSHDIWEPENLSFVILKCLQKLQNWVDDWNCPNYFIPEENMFETKLTDYDRCRLTDCFSLLISKCYTFFLLIPFSNADEIWSIDDYVSLRVSRRQTYIDTFVYFVEKHWNQFKLDLKSKLKFTRNIVCCLNYLIEKYSTKSQPPITYVYPFPEVCVNKIIRSYILSIEIEIESNFVLNETAQNAFYEIRSCLCYVIYDLQLKICVQEPNNLIKNIDNIGKEAEWPAVFNLSMKKANVFYSNGLYDLSHSVLLDALSVTKIFVVCNVHASMIGKRAVCRRLSVFVEHFLSKHDSISKTEMTYELSKRCTTWIIFDKDELSFKPLVYEPLGSFKLNLRPRQSYVVKHNGDSILTRVWIDPVFFAFYLMYKNKEATENQSAMNLTLFHLESMINEDIQEPKLCHVKTALNVLGHIYVTKGWHNLAVQCFGRSLKVDPSNNAVKWHIMFMLFG